MLVLSRKVGESILINGNIKVTITDIDGGKVRVGIEAPRDIPVYREELLRARQESAEPAPELAAYAGSR